MRLLGYEVRLGAWYNRHIKPLPELVGMVLRVEFLKDDGTPLALGEPVVAVLEWPPGHAPGGCDDDVPG